MSVTPPPVGAVLRPFGPEGCRMKSESKTQNRKRKRKPKPKPKPKHKTENQNQNQHQIFKIFFHTQMRKYLQKPTQICPTIFRKSLYSFLVSTFTFHFRNPFSKSNTEFLGSGQQIIFIPTLTKFQEKFQEYNPKKTLKNFFYPVPSVRGIWTQNP